MHRNSLLEMSGRAMHQIVRLTLNKANDSPMMQEMSFDGMNSDGRGVVERIQHFGFTSTPLPRDEQKGGQQGGQQAGGGEPNKGPAAEGIAVFIGGQRNHPVVIAVDDRRHRPMGLKPGENAQYDDNGQMTLIRRDGTFMLSLDDEEGSGNGGASTRAADGSQQQNKERMASLRHVMKKKQQRPGQSGGASGAGGSGGGASSRDASGGSSQSQQQEDFKHEGETVNTEVRCKKNTVEILDGETVVGVYDKRSGTWTFNSKNITLTASDHLTLECTGGATDIKGKPIKFNGGGPETPPFTVPG